MTGSVDHGPRIDQRTYERAVVALHQAAASEAGRLDHAEIRRRELDLMIDFRLGQHFPLDRRDQLWEVQQRIDRKHLRLAASWIAGLLTHHLLRRQGTHLAGFVVEQYGHVLNEAELEAFFGEAEVRAPGLPFDEP